MATFEVKAYRLEIEPHNNADSLELAKVGEYRSIVRKGQFKTGDIAVYIPEQAVLPESLIEELGLVGKLAGKAKNRVKAVKLRGVLSQGLIVSSTIIANRFVGSDHDEGQEWCEYFYEGADWFDELLGITKYEPVIPAHFAGEVFYADGKTIKYDIENIKKYPTIFQDGDAVLITEKLHGTWTCFGFHPDIEHPVVTSKGLSGQGLAFKFNEKNTTSNLYVKMFYSTHNADGESVVDRIRAALQQFPDYLYTADPVYVLGEIYGPGVQDLTYDEKQANFRAFDIYVGHPGRGQYLAGNKFLYVCQHAGIQTVPVLWTGGFDKQIVYGMTNEPTTTLGEHLREGVVVRPLDEERYDEDLGRVILKSISEAYLLRNNPNATEFT